MFFEAGGPNREAGQHWVYPNVCLTIRLSHFTWTVDPCKLWSMITMPFSKDLLTIAEAAEELNVSRQRMHVLIKTYGLKKVLPSPKLALVSRKELLKIPAVRTPGPRVVR